VTVLLAVIAIAAIAWILLPLFGKVLSSSSAALVKDRQAADAAFEVRGALEGLETDFTEGKVDPEGYEMAKAELTERLAALGKGGRGKRAGQ
jgi:hypothetical protein